MLSCVQLFANLWTVTHQGPLSMEFYKQEYWSGLLFSPPEDLPGPGIEPRKPLAFQAASLPFELQGSPGTAVNLFSLWASQVGLVIKNPPANAGDIIDAGSVPGSGRSPGEGNGIPLQYSCLENPHGQRNLVGYNPLGLK